MRHLTPMPQLPHASTRRIVIEEVPTGVVGEAEMRISFEGFPEGWGLVNEVLLKASGQAAYEAVLAERRKQQQTGLTIPRIVVPGEVV